MKPRALHLFILFQTLLFLVASSITHWADSELWSIGVAKLFGTGRDVSNDYKPLFSGLLSLVYSIDLNNIQTIQFERGLFALNGLLILYFIFKLAQKIDSDPERPLIAVFLMLNCTFFLSQGFRVRSDLLATSFQLAAALCFLNARNTELNKVKWAWAALSLVLHIAIFLATPKGIYQILVNAVFLGLLHPQEKILVRAAKAIGIFVGLGFASYLVFGSNQKAYSEALSYFRNSFQPNKEHADYLSLESFKYVLQLLRENLVLILILIFSQVLRMKGKLTQISNRAWLAASLTALVFIFIHNDRLPFFILSLLPFPILWASTQLRPLPRKHILGLLLLGNSLYFFSQNLIHNNNSNQIATIQLMESMLEKFPHLNFYDGNAILNRQNKIYVFPTPAYNGNIFDVQNAIDASDLVFISNRLFLYADQVQEKLNQNSFIHLGAGIFARAKVNPGRVGKKSFVLPKHEICSETFDPAIHYLFEGHGPFQFKPVSTYQIDQKNIAIESEYPAVACTKWPQVSLKDGLSFAQIFDFDHSN